MRAARPIWLALCAVLWLASVCLAQRTLLDRTVVIVAGQPITQSDIQAARALALVEADDEGTALQRVIERALMLREVERYAAAPLDEPTLQARMDELKMRLGTSYPRILLETGMTDARLRQWVSDDRRIAAYLAQRFAAANDTARGDLITAWVAELRRRTPIVDLRRK